MMVGVCSGVVWFRGSALLWFKIVTCWNVRFTCYLYLRVEVGVFILLELFAGNIVLGLLLWV